MGCGADKPVRNLDGPDLYRSKKDGIFSAFTHSTHRNPNNWIFERYSRTTGYFIENRLPIKAISLDPKIAIGIHYSC
jgi:hypothetical protein